MKIPRVKTPCKDCPFRKDTLEGWLGEDRMTEILASDLFPCHKTTGGRLRDRKQCAGHMLMKGHENAFVRLAARMNEDLGLKGAELVFDTKQACIDHHSWI